LLESWRLPPEFENRWWARRFHRGARVLHDRFLEDGRMTLVREVPSYGDARLASLLQRNGIALCRRGRSSSSSAQGSSIWSG
jgi:hypothetical protein